MMRTGVIAYLIQLLLRKLVERRLGWMKFEKQVKISIEQYTISRQMYKWRQFLVSLF